MKMNSKIFALIALISILSINLFFGLPRLGKYSAVDEPYWTYDRISKFWTSVKKQKWKSTDINDKPGITVAILSGFGLLKYDPMQYKSLRDDAKTESQLKDINGINFLFRLPIYLFSILMLPLFYFFLKKLFNKTVAIIGLALIGLSPIILGISLIINPDSLLWIFLPFSLLTYFIFQKDKVVNKKYLYLSGFFLGLSLLTKYVSNILYVFYFLIPFANYIFAEDKPNLNKYLKSSLIHYLILIGISMLTYFVLYPAAWVNFDILLEGTFLSQAFESTWPIFAAAFGLIAADTFLLKNKISSFVLGTISIYRKLITSTVFAIFLASIFAVLLNVYLGMKPFDFVATLSSPKGIGSAPILSRYAGAILADLYSLIFAISPLALFAIISAIFLQFKKKKIELESQVIFYFVSFILFYYLASSVNNVAATVRYQIILFPLALIIAAIRLAQIIDSKTIKKYFSKPLSIAVIITILTSSLLIVKPFYFAYASFLLPEKYFVNYKDMGDGSYEAAAYLNSLPNAKNMTIWSDKGAVCALFVGECNIRFREKELKSTKFDYVVVSSGRKSRTLKLSGPVNNIIDFRKAYDTNDTVYSLIIGNRPTNYVKVIDAKLLSQQQ